MEQLFILYVCLVMILWLCLNLEDMIEDNTEEELRSNYLAWFIMTTFLMTICFYVITFQ